MSQLPKMRWRIDLLRYGENCKVLVADFPYQYGLTQNCTERNALMLFTTYTFCLMMNGFSYTNRYYLYTYYYCKQENLIFRVAYLMMQFGELCVDVFNTTKFPL